MNSACNHVQHAVRSGFKKPSGGERLRLPAQLAGNLHEFLCPLKHLAALLFCYFDQRLVVTLLPEIKGLSNILMKLRLEPDPV